MRSEGESVEHLEYDSARVFNEAVKRTVLVDKT